MAVKEKAVFPTKAGTLGKTASKSQTKSNSSPAKHQDHGDNSSKSLNLPHDNSTASQRQTVLSHLLQHRTLTSLEGHRDLNILRLAARIKELRDAGYPIETHWINDVTSEGHVHRVANYVLASSRQLSLLDLSENRRSEDV